MMKFAVIVFPGSNCDDDIVHVLQDVMMQNVVKVWHKETVLPEVDAVVLPGGFSYGDYLRCGAIARFSPIMQRVVEFANHGGFVMGICNGFQVLCESGLLPGALLRNDKLLFISKNVHLSAKNKESLWSKDIDKTLTMPIAHAEGRYYCDKETLKQLKKNKQIIYEYCTEEGEVTPLSNPNGSLNNIAGICNERGNVFGMMPHPERASEKELGCTDGRYIFESLLKNAYTFSLQLKANERIKELRNERVA